MVTCKCLITLFAAILLPKLAQAVDPNDVKFLKFFNPLLDNANAKLNRQKLSNADGFAGEYQDFLLDDEANGKLARASVEQLIENPGFHYETHKIITEDGYVTQLFRLINPLANRTQLRWPPVVLFHGGLTDPTSWLWSSNVQHHPELYPRTSADGPITSSNRSLAFVLANHGHDVWLATSRGSNKRNQGHTKLKTRPDKVLGESSLKVAKDRLKYWRFSFDDHIQYEFPAQMDKVLEVTKSRKISVIAMSIGTMIVTPLLATNKRYANKVHNYVAMGPPLTSRGTNNLFKLVCPLFVGAPYELALPFTTELITSSLTQELLLSLGARKRCRYSIVWFIFAIILGSSPTFQTGLENPVLGHVFQPTGLNYAKHYCQQTLASRYLKFDHGHAKNLKIYGSPKPPAYDVSRLPLKNGWLIVSGGNDNFASPPSAQQLLKEVRPRAKHIVAPKFNHIDLLASMSNDRYVNLPILNYLNSFQPN